MNVLETEWWRVGIPPEWWAEQDDDTVVIGDRDDVGCIEVSTLRSDGEALDAGALEELARANGEPDWYWERLQIGEFIACRTRYREEGSAVREWYLAAGDLLLFVTYSCDAENAGMDDAAVDEILDTLARVA